VIEMSIKQVVKLYIHGLILTLIGLAFSYSLDYIDINTDLGIAVSILLMFIGLPCSFALANAFMFKKLYNRIIVYSRKTLINLILDGYSLMLLILILGIIISKMYAISSLINIVLSVITPLIFGYSAFKLTQKLYRFTGKM